MMGPPLIFKARLFIKILNQNFQQGSFCARTLCIKDNVPKLGGSTLTDSRHGDRQTDKTIGRRDELYSKVRRMPSFPTSVFAAGTAKRTAEMLKRKAAQSQASVDQEEGTGEQLGGGRQRGTGRLVPPDRPLSPAEWRKLKDASNSPEHFDVRMMLSLLTSGAELDVAKSLLNFVALETGTMSYQLLLRYLALCVNGGHDAEVADVHQIMLGVFPSLDTGASSLFIRGFSHTQRWREALHILRDMKKVISPSPRNYGHVISGALLHGDAATAWALHDEVIAEGMSPQTETWRELFEGGMRDKEGEAMNMLQADYSERLLAVLAYMRDNQVYPQQSLISTMKTWFQSLPGHTWRGEWTTVTPKGVCRCCGSAVESIQLTHEEYRHLKDRVMADIIQGKDVFNKTTPEELESFKAFVQKKPPFNVVVDGLNVANVTRGRQSETLLAVVSELERRGQTALVLGRRHMLRPSGAWDRRHMSLVQQKAHCFFTENISEDDPFLLYATLHSGNHCLFISRDLMRDHKACLSDPLTRRLFFKWQRGHQLVIHGHVTAGRRVRFQVIPAYDTIVQGGAGSWHLPYDDTEDRSSYEVPQKWLCLADQHGGEPNGTHMQT